jgi:isoaspartyl peptidase/L-asparaginase-like protein (Ntn-hydrolase superfamily)
MDIIVPAVIAHGGAGPGPNRQENLEIAVQKAADILKSGGNALEAAVEACVILEDDPVFNAGTGSVIRTDGSVLTDASIQIGDGRLGFVIAMEDTPNPSRVAADLLDEEINGLTSEGARIWADNRGHQRSKVAGRSPEGQIGDINAEIMGDTVGVIARDNSGMIVVATSTGGCSFRPPGRVGDVPLPGSGFWAEDCLAVAATGIGEAITRALLSNKVYERIKNEEISLEDSMEWGIRSLISPEHSVGLIALGPTGAGIGVANTDMPWATWEAESNG